VWEHIEIRSWVDAGAAVAVDLNALHHLIAGFVLYDCSSGVEGKNQASVEVIDVHIPKESKVAVLACLAV